MSEEQSFKSRLSDVFGGLDQVKFKSDSSLKQEKYEENKVDQGGFRVPRSPANSPSSRGGGGGSNRTVVRAGVVTIPFFELLIDIFIQVWRWSLSLIGGVLNEPKGGR